MKTVCVVFGGVSSEHEVSLRSATAVLRNLPQDRYTPVMVGITKDGRWLRYQGPLEDIQSGAWQQGDVTPATWSPDRSELGGLLVFAEGGVSRVQVDVVFPVLHGKNGEDGAIQGLFELSGIPFVGCHTRSSAVCMDKDMAHRLLLAAGVPKTELVVLTERDLSDIASLEKKLAERLGYPMFVKPANAGSSVGVTKVKSPDMLEQALRDVLPHDDKILVEKMIQGQEVECAVMGNRDPIASEVLGEIVPPDGVYDYESKYLNDSAGLHVPARVSDEVCRQLRAMAVRAYRALDCRGFARVDFFVTPEERVVLNEINTIPGFTSISMFPKLFEASGVSFPEIVDRLITYALEG